GLRAFAVEACPERAQRVEWAAQDDTCLGTRLSALFLFDARLHAHSAADRGVSPRVHFDLLLEWTGLRARAVDRDGDRLLTFRRQLAVVVVIEAAATRARDGNLDRRGARVGDRELTHRARAFADRAVIGSGRRDLQLH